MLHLYALFEEYIRILCICAVYIRGTCSLSGGMCGLQHTERIHTAKTKSPGPFCEPSGPERVPGNRIFTLRTNAKLSQEKLAEKLGVSHRHLGDLERGSSNGSVKILIDIAEYFHVSMDYLLLGRDPSRDQFQNELQAAIDHLEKIKGLL